MKTLKDLFWFTRTKIDGWSYLGLCVLMWIPYFIVGFNQIKLATPSYFIQYGPDGLQYWGGEPRSFFASFPFYLLAWWGTMSLTYRRAAQFSAHPLALIFGSFGLMVGNAPGTNSSNYKNKPDATRK